MDCDHVFDILTRGPFPTGDPVDELVEAHLEVCAECWRFAEALRPALEVFQEAVPPAEGRDLPGYWGDARPAASVVAEISSSSARSVLVPVRRKVADRRYRPLLEPTSGPGLIDVLKIVGLVTALAAMAVGVGWLLTSW